jgi:hypothetical protein
METDKTLSDIARSVLVSSPESDQRSFREKAGLLALLNLLGIVESFYGDGQGAQSSAGLLSSLALGSGAVAPQGQKEPDLVSSIMSLAGKMLGGREGQGGIDPAMIGTLMGALSALTKARTLSPRYASPTPGSGPTGETGPDAPSDSLDGSEGPDEQAGEDGGSTGEGDEAGLGEGERANGPASPSAAPAPPGAPTPQSPLQQILGIDPRIITLALNVLADIMKARNAAQSERAGAEKGRPAARSDSAAPETEVTVTPDGKTVVIPKARRQPRERLYHKPGLGIYRKRLEEAVQ